MIKEFVPYEQALELKELGFDEPCLAYYEGNELTHGMLNDIGKKRYLRTPIFQQAFRWFREEYELVIQYIPSELDNSEGQSILHHQYKISEYDSWRGGRRNTVETELNEDYGEAELACLIKLIDIVKNLNKS